MDSTAFLPGAWLSEWVMAYDNRMNSLGAGRAEDGRGTACRYDLLRLGNIDFDQDIQDVPHYAPEIPKYFGHESLLFKGSEGIDDFHRYSGYNSPMLGTLSTDSDGNDMVVDSLKPTRIDDTLVLRMSFGIELPDSDDEDPYVEARKPVGLRKANRLKSAPQPLQFRRTPVTLPARSPSMSCFIPESPILQSPNRHYYARITG